MVGNIVAPVPAQISASSLPGSPSQSSSVSANTAELGVDALILADIEVMDYAAQRWPQLPLHLSVQAFGTNYPALSFYHENFGIRCLVQGHISLAFQFMGLLALVTKIL